MPVPARSSSMCQVSLAEPGLLRRVRERKHASAGFSREHPGAAAGATVASAGVGVLLGLSLGLSLGLLAVAGADDELPSSWCSALSMRVVSLPPGTQRFSRFSFCKAMASE